MLSFVNYNLIIIIFTFEKWIPPYIIFHPLLGNIGSAPPWVMLDLPCPLAYQTNTITLRKVKHINAGIYLHLDSLTHQSVEANRLMLCVILVILGGVI